MNRWHEYIAIGKQSVNKLGRCISAAVASIDTERGGLRYARVPAYQLLT